MSRARDYIRYGSEDLNVESKIIIDWASFCRILKTYVPLDDFRRLTQKEIELFEYTISLKDKIDKEK